MPFNPISVQLKQCLTVVETLSDSAGSLVAGGNTVTHQGMDQVSGPFNAGSQPAVQACAFAQVDIAGGAGAVDMTNLVGTNGKALDATGLKAVGVLIEAPETNDNPITLTPGGSNGYALLGPGFSVTLAPGDTYGPFWKPAGGPVVGPTAKTLALAGTGTGDGLNIGFVLG